MLLALFVPDRSQRGRRVIPGPGVRPPSHLFDRIPWQPLRQPAVSSHSCKLQASLNHILDILGPSPEDLGQDLLGSLQLNEFMISYLPGLDELGFPPPRQPHEYASRVAWLLIGS